jgi:hypothetical protein
MAITTSNSIKVNPRFVFIMGTGSQKSRVPAPGRLRIFVGALPERQFTDKKPQTNVKTARSLGNVLARPGPTGG